MTRSCFFSFSTGFSRAVVLTVLLSGALIATRTAQADEFSLLPNGDPVYGQLTSLIRPSDNKISSPLTRYEAALQAARAMMDAQGRNPKQVTRAQWRSIKALCVSLKTELRQLGMDVDAIQVLADRNLKATEFKASDLPAPAPLPKALPSRLASVSALSAKTAAPRGSVLLASPGLNSASVSSSVATIPLSQQLRVGASLMATDRVGDDPFSAPFGQTNRALPSNLSAGTARNLASETSVAYDLSPWLTVRAGGSQRNLQGGVGTSPILQAPFFANATGAKGAGGGVDINVGPLKFSTEMERLRNNSGAAASRIGGGASLSMNRLSMSVNMSRLQPEDTAVLPATAAQFGLGLDVTQRLKLSLLYQSLFAQTASSTPSSESRVSGGVSLSF